MINTRLSPYLLQFGMIPNTFTESLTYEQQLIEIYKAICEIIKELDEISIDNIQKIIDEEIAKLKQYVDTQDEKLYNAIDEAYQNSKNYTDLEVAKASEILIQLMKSYDLQLKNELLVLIDDLQKQINDISTNGIKILNPTNGKMEYLDKVIADIYDKLRYYGLTALEYDTLGLTAKEYDDLMLSAQEYDLYGRSILIHDNRNHYMLSPFDGKLTLIYDIINQLAGLHKASITALEYDTLGLTAIEYDNKDLSAYDYDWLARIIFGLEPANEYLLTSSSSTQLLDSNIALASDKKLLLKRPNGVDENAISLGVYGSYEQEEIGSMADPTCLNHNAVGVDGTVVGKNIIVNYRDENGDKQADNIAYLSDIQSGGKQITRFWTNPSSSSSDVEVDITDLDFDYLKLTYAVSSGQNRFVYDIPSGKPEVSGDIISLTASYSIINSNLSRLDTYNKNIQIRNTNGIITLNSPSTEVLHRLTSDGTISVSNTSNYVLLKTIDVIKL